jgi:glutathione S-transferase
MANLEVIELYGSPFSERLRWALTCKGAAHARKPFVPIAGEEDHRKATGIATAPVLLADGKVVGDSNRALEWLERTSPQPPLLPKDPSQRSQVRTWEAFASEVLAPYARLTAIGKFKKLGIQPLADHFAAKYHWSKEAEQRALEFLQDVLPDLARATASGGYLVGDGFTRADLTVASMLATVFGHPEDELFQLDGAMRPMFGMPLGEDPALVPLRRWRDEMYRRHRGERVTPPVG